MRRYFLVFALCILAACAPPSTLTPLATPARATEQALPALEGKWIVKLTHSGGIMGLMRWIEISSDGKFIVTDERADETVKGRLSNQELTELKGIIVESRYQASPAPEGTICADCFLYDLEIQSAGKSFQVQLNDLTLPQSGLEPLVTYLRSLLEETLK